jgi:LuxR family quorum sensing-dependent transcriptional regulator
MPRRTATKADQQQLRRAPGDAELGARLMDFATRTAEFATPDEVLNALNRAASRTHPLHVLGAGLFPRRLGDWSAVRLGQTVFVHKDAPRGWWRDYSQRGPLGYDPGIMMARMSLSPYTWTESSRMIEPVGSDRWAMELALKHGIRDGLTCPVGGRWVLAFWSRKVLSEVLSSEARALAFMAASFAVMRIQALLGPDPANVASLTLLTARERAVLRLASEGREIKGIAEALELGEETIRTHLRKAKSKLGAKNRTQAVAEAIRQQLLP